MADLVITMLDDRARLHEFQNFAESVFHWLRDNGHVTIGFTDLDRGASQFVVGGVKASKLRRVVRWVEHQALGEHVSVTVVIQH